MKLFFLFWLPLAQAAVKRNVDFTLHESGSLSTFLNEVYVFSYKECRDRAYLLNNAIMQNISDSAKASGCILDTSLEIPRIYWNTNTESTVDCTTDYPCVTGTAVPRNTFTFGMKELKNTTDVRATKAATVQFGKTLVTTVPVLTANEWLGGVDGGHIRQDICGLESSCPALTNSKRCYKGKTKGDSTENQELHENFVHTPEYEAHEFITINWVEVTGGSVTYFLETPCTTPATCETQCANDRFCTGYTTYNHGLDKTLAGRYGFVDTQVYDIIPLDSTEVINQGTQTDCQNYATSTAQTYKGDLDTTDPSFLTDVRSWSVISVGSAASEGDPEYLSEDECRAYANFLAGTGTFEEHARGCVGPYTGNYYSNIYAPYPCYLKCKSDEDCRFFQLAQGGVPYGWKCYTYYGGCEANGGLNTYKMFVPLYSFSVATESGNPRGCFSQPDSTIVYFNNAASTSMCGNTYNSNCIQKRINVPAGCFKLNFPAGDTLNTHNGVWWNPGTPGTGYTLSLIHI